MFTNILLMTKRTIGLVGTLAMLGATIGASPHQSATHSSPQATSSHEQAKSPAQASSHAGPAVTPAEAQSQLKEGNARFVSGKSEFPRQDMARLSETAPAQHPKATILTCSDSRIPVEKVFDQGIGDLFVIRVAGNVCDVDETGTIEYGVEHLGTPILLVLGHTKCGAVTAVATNAEVHGSIPQLVDNIGPAVERAHKLNPSLEGKELVPAATTENVWQSIEDMLQRSSILREKVIEGAVKVYGGLYHLEDGTVEWLGPHPRQTALLASPMSTPETAEATHHQDSHGSLPDVSHVEAPEGITPTMAFDWLKEGNARFTDQKQIYPNQSASYRADLVAAQHPFATILSCSDSRVPLENLFDVGAGDIFVVRVAGNVADVDEIGSIEYGTGHLGTPLLVVMGHTACGAVTAVATNAEVGGSIPELVDNIKPAVEKAAHDNPSLSGKELVPAAIKANVWNSIEQLYTGSPIVCALVKAGKLSVQGALYHLDNGSVEWLGKHPNQAEFVSGQVPATSHENKPAARFATPAHAEATSHTATAAPAEHTAPADEHPAPAPAEHKADPSSDKQVDKLDAALAALESTVNSMTAAPTTDKAAKPTTAPEMAAKENSSRLSDTELASIIADIEYLKSELVQLKGQTAEATKTLASLEDVTVAPVGSAPQLNKLAALVTTLNQSIEQQKASTKLAVNATTVGHGTIQFNGFVHQQYYSKFGTSKSSTFDSKRARLGVSGDVNSYARLDFVGEFAKAPKLLDGVMSLSPNKNWTVKVGQGKVPFSTDILRSSTATPFVNLSLASSLGPDRDIGMSVRYGTKFSKTSGIDFYTGVFNGSGINASDANTNKNLAFRAVTKIGTQFTLAPNWYYGKTNDTGSVKQNLSTYGASVAWAAKHDVVEAEYLGSTIGAGRKEGWYIFGGHTIATGSKFLQEIQFAARYEQMNPSVAAGGDKTNRVTIGANLFIDKKYTLIQLNYQINGEQTTSIKNDEFLMNFQVAF
jgi:carbonic anhydrase